MYSVSAAQQILDGPVDKAAKIVEAIEASMTTPEAETSSAYLAAKIVVLKNTTIHNSVREEYEAEVYRLSLLLGRLRLDGLTAANARRRAGTRYLGETEVLQRVHKGQRLFYSPDQDSSQAQFEGREDGKRLKVRRRVWVNLVRSLELRKPEHLSIRSPFRLPKHTSQEEPMR